MRTLPGWSAVILSLGAASCGRVPDQFYASAEMGTKIIRVEVKNAGEVATKLIGTTGSVGCISMALSPSGNLYSMCGPGAGAPGSQQLASIDVATGQAKPFGMVVDGLTVMALKFAPDGTLYAAGDSKSSSPTFNSLYTVDPKTGAFMRVGSTGAAAFLMDFAFDPQGTMYAASSNTLYTIDRKSGVATRVADFVGGSAIMGLAFGAGQGKLYASDFKVPISDLYSVDAKTGFLSPMGKLGYANSHNLVAISR
jgi:DNA-binding beta-propeller fold protein YncE